MSKQNRVNYETNTAEPTAQGATAVLEDVPITKPNAVKEQPKPVVSAKVDPTDLQYFLDNMRVSDKDALGAEPYSWQNRDESKFWKILWVPLARYLSYRDALLSRAIVLVEKSGSILTRPFSGDGGLFTDSTFDPATGRVHSKVVKKNDRTGDWEPEMVLCLQPIAAAQAMTKKMVERVVEKTEKKPEQRTAEERAEMYKIARDSGAKSNAIQVNSHEGWDDL